VVHLRPLPRDGAWTGLRRGRRNERIRDRLRCLRRDHRAGVIVAGFRVGSPARRSRGPREAASPRDFAEILRNRAVLGCWSPPSSRRTRGGRCSPSSPFTRRTRISIAQTGLIFTTQAGVNALCRIPIGHFQDRTGNRRSFILWGTRCSGSASPSPGWRAGRCRSTFSSPASAPRWRDVHGGRAVLRNRWTPRAWIGDGGYNTCIYGGSWPPRPRSGS